jgi:hypothetical protein
MEVAGLAQPMTLLANARQSKAHANKLSGILSA